MKRVLSLLIAFVMILGLAVPGVTAAEGTTEVERTEGGVVYYPFNRNPGNFFTPYNAGIVASYGWCSLEPLAWSKTDGSFYPVLAESWVMDNENNTLTIKLKEGITFSNGDPFNAEDVVFTHSIREEYGTSTVIGNPEKIEALDEYTVQFTWPSFGLNYEQQVLPQYIYSKETFEEKGLDWMLNNIVGTGPYVLDEYIPDVDISFVRNENYWGETVPGPDGFKWNVITDATATLAAFLNGDVDAYTQVSDPIIMTQLEANGYEGVLNKNAQSFCCQIQIIQKDPEAPLSNADVRAAIYKGVNWDDMALSVVGPTAYHTDIIGSVEMPYYKDSIEQHEFDLEGAKKDLADAGYPDGFTTTIYGAQTDAPAMVYLQAALAQMNIAADVVTVDGSLRGSDYVTGKVIDTGLVFSGYGFGPSNPMDRFNKFISPNGTWAGGVEFAPEMVELWEKARNAKTVEERDEALYEYCDKYVNQYHYMFPAYSGTSYDFYQPWYHITDLANGGNGMDPFEIWVDKH